MKAHPMLFNGPMVKAILDGRKTQTRRVLKPEPGAKRCGHIILRDYNKSHEGCLWWWDGKHDRVGWSQELPYAPGDMLWVRETFSGPWAYEGLPPSEWQPFDNWYWADGNPPDGDWTRPRPSIHMPRWASRLTLEVESVKVERVQDISGYDAYWEGVCQSKTGHDAGHPSYTIDMFRRIWDSLNAKRGFGWDANPWICALTFKPHKCNVDQMKELT